MPNPTDNPTPAPVKEDALPALRITAGRLFHAGRELKNYGTTVERICRDAACAYANSENSSAERAELPALVARMIANAEEVAAALPELRALTGGKGDAPAKLIIEEGGFSIQTKYLPATNTRGSRIKAWRVDCDHNGKTESITVSFDHGAHDPHDDAARAWIARHWKDDAKRKPIARLFKGSAPAGRVYTVRF